MIRILTICSVLLCCATAQASGVDDLRRAMQAGRDGHFKTADRLYAKAIGSGKLSKRQLAGALYNRGHLRYRSGQNDRAITDFNRAIKIAPKDGIAYYYRGLAYEKKRHHQQARSDFRTAQRLRYRSAKLHTKLKVHRGIAALGKGTKAHGTVWVTREPVNVRRGPSSITDRITTLPEGARVTVVGTKRRKDWHRVTRHGEVIGFVYEPLLKRVR
jgi:hypothetical protein